MYKIISTAAAILLMIGLVGLIGFININDMFFAGSDIVMTDEPTENNQNQTDDNTNKVLLLLPAIVEKSFFENRVLACITEQRDLDKMHAYYTLKNPTSPDLTEEAKAELIAEYPICEKTPVYVFDPNANERERDSILEIYRKYTDLTENDIIKMFIDYGVYYNMTAEDVIQMYANYGVTYEPPVTDTTEEINITDEYIVINGKRYGMAETELMIQCYTKLTDADIEPLKHMVNLQSLYILTDDSNMAGAMPFKSNATYSDLSILAGLKNLKILDLRGSKINDISPLTGLKNLTNLNLKGGQISDISPLTELPNLTELGLSENQISDISVLAGMTNLTYLSLDDNPISDFSPLAELTNLKSLVLNKSQINDISVLAGLSYLEKLFLADNQITDISALAGLANLKWLWLDKNQIDDISPLLGLTNLESLSVFNNPLTPKQIEELREALPNTKIIADLKDMLSGY